MLNLSRNLSVGHFCFFRTNNATIDLIRFTTWTRFLPLFNRYSSLCPRCFIINYPLIMNTLMYSSRYIFVLNFDHFPTLSVRWFKTHELFIMIIFWRLLFMMSVLSFLFSTVLWDYHIIKWIFSCILLMLSVRILWYSLLNKFI